jgi:helicase-like protein
LHYSLKLPSVDSTSNNFHRGEEFRKTYAELGTIREYFGTTVPWLLCSATLPQHVKDEVLSSIKIKNPVEVVSDLNRPNCYYNLLLSGGVDYKSGPTALDFLFDDCDGPTSTPEDIPKTLVYFEEIQVLLAFQAHLRDILPAHLKAQGLQIVESYYATRTTDKKTIVRAQFKVGKICRILCVTEAFGMGLDISNITRVYNWGLPRSVSSLIQRFGRAARDGTLTACCTLVISQDYHKITPEDDFECSNNTQRNLKTKRPAIYDILRSKCLRQGFLKYLGVGSEYKSSPSGTCCARCSERDNHPTAVIGSRGLCNEAKEAARNAVPSERLPLTHAWIVESVMKQLKLWRDEVTEASLKGKTPHDLWRPAGCIPDAVLLELAKGARAIVDKRWPINRVSSWYGWMLWGDSKYPEYMVSTYINIGWKEGMERIKQEKKRKGKAAAQRRVLDRVEGRNQQRTFGPSVRASSHQSANIRLGPGSPTPATRSHQGMKATDSSYTPSLSRRGSNTSAASDADAASTTSATIGAAGRAAWEGIFPVNSPYL